MPAKKQKTKKSTPPQKKPNREKFIVTFLLVFSGISLVTALVLFVWFPENRSLFSVVENQQAYAPLWISFFYLSLINLMAAGAAWVFQRMKKRKE